MRKAVYICLIALLLSACANNAQAEEVDKPEISAAVTATATTTVPSASTTTVSAEEKEIITSSTTIASEESETSSETTESTTSTERENEAATSQTEVSVSDKTGTSMATSASVSESKPKVTTVSSVPKKSVSHTTTEALIQTTTEKPKDTTTTAAAATTTTTTAAPSGIKWSDSMKVWRKLCEGKKLTGSEQDLIRSEILDYAVSSFNGKKDIHVSFGIDSYDISYEKPLNLKANKKMTSMSNAHMDAYADPNSKGLIDYAKSEKEIYDIVSDTRQCCLHVIDYGLFNRWEIFTINNDLKYASDIDFGIGFDEDMAIWFLTQD